MASETTSETRSPTSLIDQLFSNRLAKYRRWWRWAVVETVDQADVIEKRREEAYTSPRYLFMLAMSAGIAILGLLLSSPAVVIGAMLIAPLMGPIMGAGFAFAIGDYRWLRGSTLALAAGTVLGIALTALIVYISPLKTVTPEIAARTQPNLFDLAVAIFSSLAGGYSMIRGREGTIVGVAIATALMPPLAVVGFGLATSNWTVFWGALLLYVTNLMTIALTATVMARLYGFSHRLSQKQTHWQTVVIMVVFVALSVPLFIALERIAWEANAARNVRTAVMAGFGPDARISQLDFDLNTDPVAVSATVLTPEPSETAENDSEAALSSALGRDVDLILTQFRVGTAAEAEAIELLASQIDQDQALNEQARVLAEKMALVAGTQIADITIDREARRALVRARTIAGAGMATYRALERRVRDTAPGWTVRIEPPLLPLPTIAFADGEPTPGGRASLELVAWAASRRGQTITLTGGTPATREVAADILAEAGVTPILAVGGPTMSAQWATEPPPETDNAAN